MQNAPKGAFCNTFVLSTFIKLPVVIKTFVLSIFEWPFYTGFTVVFFLYPDVEIVPDENELRDIFRDAVKNLPKGKLRKTLNSDLESHLETLQK